jgi:hypothetical protein
MRGGGLVVVVTADAEGHGGRPVGPRWSVDLAFLILF